MSRSTTKHRLYFLLISSQLSSSTIITIKVFFQTRERKRNYADAFWNKYRKHYSPYTNLVNLVVKCFINEHLYFILNTSCFIFLIVVDYLRIILSLISQSLFLDTLLTLSFFIPTTKSSYKDSFIAQIFFKNHFNVNCIFFIFAIISRLFCISIFCYKWQIYVNTRMPLKDIIVIAFFSASFNNKVRLGM